MAKFDFNRSLYAKLFSEKEGARAIKAILDDSDLLYTNYGWYLTQGSKAPASSPTDDKGVAMFRVTARSIEAAPIMDLRAPLGQAHQMDEKGGSEYVATIPDFISRARQETAAERDYRIRQFQQFGDDDPLLAYWVSIAQTIKDSSDATMNWMTAQLMTKGYINYSSMGRGIQAPLHKVPIPEENFVTAGTKVWTDSECQLLSQMATIEEKFRDKWGYGGAMVWQMPKDMFYNVFLKNAEVIELVKNYRYLNDIASTDAMNITEEMFRTAFNDYQGVSSIEVVTEKERNDNGTTDSFVHGWDQNIAVLRPAGDAVEFEYTTPLDKYMYDNYSNGDVTKVFGSFSNGLGMIVNETAKDGQYNKWSTYGIMSAAPALINFPNHVIVDTTTADA